MAHQVHRLTLAFLAAFAVIALFTGYWNVVAGPDLLARPDNPRRYLLERRLPRGLIYDRHGAVLAENSGPPGQLERHYPYPALAPVLGYASPFFGVAGLEAAADQHLHGDAQWGVRDWLSQGLAPYDANVGQPLTLTLDLTLQRVADAALAGHTGAVVLLEIHSGDIVAMSSAPTYDANQLADQWETLLTDPRAPLLNRATQALYQPGGAIWPVILAGALQAGYGDLAAPFPQATDPVQVDGHTLQCLTSPLSPTLTLGAALQAGCPQPFTLLGRRLGRGALLQNYRALRLFEAPAMTLPTIAATEALSGTAELEAIGQGTLTLTPLQLALITATFAREGVWLAPRLVQDPTAASPVGVPVIQRSAAQQIAPLLAAGYSATALASDTGRTLAWYTAFDDQYALAVLLEEATAAEAVAVGQTVLGQTGAGK